MENIKELKWSDLSVKVGKKVVVRKEAGYIRSHTMTALLGPSGAGKSTLLNVLTGRSSLNARGLIFYNGKLLEYGSSWPIRVGYVTQEFAAFKNQTVYETLRFVCRMLGSNIKEADFFIDILGMRECKNTYISKVSGGELKRVSIAVELIGSPKLIFLDEPTSGLDSTSAKNLLSYLRILASQGAAIFMTLHQPSTEIIRMFHNIYLISFGSSIYQGTLDNSLEYFKSLGYLHEKNTNPSDFLLDLVSFKPLLEDTRESQKRIEKLQESWIKRSKTKDFSYCRDKCIERDIGSVNNDDDSPLETKFPLNNNQRNEGLNDLSDIRNDETSSHAPEAVSKNFCNLAQSSEIDDRDFSQYRIPENRNRGSPVSRGFFSRFFWVYIRDITEIMRQLKSHFREAFTIVIIAVLIYFGRNHDYPINLISLQNGFRKILLLLNFTSSMSVCLACFPSEWPIIVRERKSGMCDGFTTYCSKLFAISSFGIPIHSMTNALFLYILEMHTDVKCFQIILFICALASVFTIAFGLTVGLIFRSVKTSQLVGSLLFSALILSNVLRETKLYTSNTLFRFFTKIITPMHEIEAVFQKLMLTTLNHSLLSLKNSAQGPKKLILFEYFEDDLQKEADAFNYDFVFDFRHAYRASGNLCFYILFIAVIGSFYLHFSTRQRMFIKDPKR